MQYTALPANSIISTYVPGQGFWLLGHSTEDGGPPDLANRWYRMKGNSDAISADNILERGTTVTQGPPPSARFPLIGRPGTGFEGRVVGPTGDIDTSPAGTPAGAPPGGGSMSLVATSGGGGHFDRTPASSGFLAPVTDDGPDLLDEMIDIVPDVYGSFIAPPPVPPSLAGASVSGGGTPALDAALFNNNTYLFRVVSLGKRAELLVALKDVVVILRQRYRTQLRGRRRPGAARDLINIFGEALASIQPLPSPPDNLPGDTAGNIDNQTKYITSLFYAAQQDDRYRLATKVVAAVVDRWQLAAQAA